MNPADCRADLATAPVPWAYTQGAGSQVTQRDFYVLKCHDGDTFSIPYDGDPTPVRIYGIDAPELKTPAGPLAKLALIRLLSTSKITIAFPAGHKRDAFGRLLCTVISNGLDVATEMLRLGQAVPYKRKTSPVGTTP
jgi:endonuclease YncB( thermonuclease family)